MGVTGEYHSLHVQFVHSQGHVYAMCLAGFMRFIKEHLGEYAHSNKLPVRAINLGVATLFSHSCLLTFCQNFFVII